MAKTNNIDMPQAQEQEFLNVQGSKELIVQPLAAQLEEGDSHFVQTTSAQLRISIIQQDVILQSLNAQIKKIYREVDLPGKTVRSSIAGSCSLSSLTEWWNQ